MLFLKALESFDAPFLEKEISKRFRDNLVFFKSYHPNLFNALNTPFKNYQLLFEKNHFNLLHTPTNALSYPKAQMIEIAFNMAHSPLNNPRWSLDNNHLSLNYLKNQNNHKLPLTLKATHAIPNFLNQTQTPCSLGQFLPPTMIYGVLDGLFLAILQAQNYRFHSLYLFEENLDLFKISCYFVRYEDLIIKGAKLFIQGFFNPNELKIDFLKRPVTHSFLKLEIMPYKSAFNARMRENIQNYYKQALRGWGSFEDELLGFKNTLKNLPLYKTLKTKPKKINAPICVVGNGPSLDLLLPFLKENEENCIIFSCGTALKPLKTHGIKVDFQIEVERIDYLKEVLEKAPLKDTPLIGANMLNPNAFFLAKEAFMFMRGGSACAYISPLSVEYAAPFVGNAGVALASLMSDEIYLCALDCAYIKGFKKHAKNSYYENEKEIDTSSLISVEGNFKGYETFSDSLFLLSKERIEEALIYYKPKKVYNLSYGAKIKHAFSVDHSQIKLKNSNKQEAIARIKNMFNSPNNHAKDLKNLQKNLIRFKESFFKSLNTPCQSKQEVFEWVDNLNILCQTTSTKNPTIGILFEGSVAHILQSVLIVSLHVKENELKELIKRSQNTLKQFLKEACLLLQMQLKKP
ncbi:motility associated factor glycosyltransferase family protein [Helicobacter acinonychis]|uniref:motility associated factor glycosyltransferase family protein n=1 Tax=Helicobacter acinonychis TaxID=212 RepID=UPI000CF075EA|nr:motility associated factor glycosyltransferase family protein [Helicobacter acinonychis]